MNTSEIHIITVVLPLIVILPGFFFFRNSKGNNSYARRRAGLIFFIFNALATTFTSAFGGASIKIIKSLPGIHQEILRLHAWTAMIAFLFSLTIAGLSVKLFRNKERRDKDKLIFSLFFAFLGFYFLSAFLAYKIR